MQNLNLGVFKKLLGYLRSSSRARILFNNHSLPNWPVFLVDWGAIFLTFLFAVILRFSFEFSAFDSGWALKQSFLVLGVYVGFEMMFRLFASQKNQTTFNDIVNVLITNTCSLAILFLISIIGRRSGNYDVITIPVSILLIHYISLNILLITVRLVSVFNARYRV
jgi:hypothetical protein